LSQVSGELDFCAQKMHEIIDILQKRLKEQDRVVFRAVDSDLCLGKYSGKQIEVNGRLAICRPLRVWVDLAGLLGCKTKIPRACSDGTMLVEYEKLHADNSFHLSKSIKRSEKYGSKSEFFEISKNEEPYFIYNFTRALSSAKIESRDRILDIGINAGDEFLAIYEMLGSERFNKKSFVGVDYCRSAIDVAKSRLEHENVELMCYDVNNLDALSLGRFDLIISIGTLQSGTIEMKPLFMSLAQEYLSSDGVFVLGFPNCRWIDGELVYGAKAPNYAKSEMSLVIKDIYWIKKYLQQHKFRVEIFGREYLFLVATRIDAAKE